MRKLLPSIPPLTMVLLLLINGYHSQGQNQAPEITNMQAVHNETAGTVTITYDLSDAEGDDIEVWLKASADSGTTYLVNTGSVTGDAGYPVSAGTDLQMEWDYPDTITNISTYQVKLVADDRFEIDVQQIVNQVDSNRLKTNMDFIAGIRHRNTGLTHLENVKDSIEQRFANYAMQVNRQSFAYQGYDAANIIGRIPGQTEERPTYIIDAHFDGVSNSPGADDNGSGVAGFLEAARILSQYNFHHSIRIIGFDLEEAGLLGSNAYVNNAGGLTWYDSIQGVFNYEMIGYYSEEPNSQSFPAGFNILFPDAYNQVASDTFKGDFITNVANEPSDSLKMRFDSAAAWYVPELEVVSVAVPGTGTTTPDLRRSDHASFWDAGIPALMLTDGAEFRNDNYHQPGDSASTLDYGFMANVVKATIGAVCHEARIQHSTTATAFVDDGTGIERLASNGAGFTLLPNPAGQHVQIKSHGFQPGLTIRLIDPTGKVLFNRTVGPSSAQQYNLDTGQFPQGIYLVELQDGKNTARQKLMVK